jgi:hypothetical protein
MAYLRGDASETKRQRKYCEIVSTTKCSSNNNSCKYCEYNSFRSSNNNNCACDDNNNSKNNIRNTKRKK